MGKWFDQIVNLFTDIPFGENELKETDKDLSLEFYLEKENKKKLPNSFPEGYISYRDKITIRWKDHDSDDYDNTDFISDNNNWLLFKTGYEESSEDVYTIKVQISKVIIDGKLSIYDYEAFSRYLIKTKEKDFIHVFDEIQSAGCHQFEIQDVDFQDWSSDSFAFIHQGGNSPQLSPIDNRKTKLELWRHTCKSDVQDISLLPEDFHITNLKNSDDLQIRFHRECILLSLIFLANDTYFDDQAENDHECNELYIHISGYSVVNSTINLNTIKLDVDNWNLLEIYKWIYSNKKIFDKMNIARNILSLNVQSNVLSVDEEVLGIMISNHNIFVKENVDRFIKVRNDVSTFLLNYRTSVDKVIATYIDRMRQSMLLIASFILTTIILKAISKEGVNDFTLPTSILIIILVLIVVSFVQLYLNYHLISSMEPKYDKILSKTHEEYKTLLNEGELEILNDADKDWAEKKCKITMAWGLTLLVLIIVDIVGIILK